MSQPPHMPDTEPNAPEKEHHGDVIIVALVAAGFAFVLTWPIGLWFVSAGGTWFFLRKRDHPVASVIKSMVAPVALGLGILSGLLIVLNAVPSIGRTGPSWLHTMETLFVFVRLYLSTLTSFSYVTMIALIAALVGLAFLAPRVKPVTRTLRLKKRVSQALAVLVILTSFSLFSERPFDHLVDSDYSEMQSRSSSLSHDYTYQLKQEWKFVGEQLVAEAAIEKLSALDEPAKQEYRDLFEQIEQHAMKIRDDYSLLSNTSNHIKEQIATRVATEIAGEYGSSGSDLFHRLDRLDAAQFRQLPSEMMRTIGVRAKSLDEWRRQRRYLDARKSVVDRQAETATAANTRRDEALAGLKRAVLETVDLSTEGLEGIVGSFTAQLVSELAGRISNKVVDGVQRGEARSAAQMWSLAIEASRSVIGNAVQIHPRRRMSELLVSDVADRVAEMYRPLTLEERLRKSLWEEERRNKEGNKRRRRTHRPRGR